MWRVAIAIDRRCSERDITTLFITRWFGVTASDADRDLARNKPRSGRSSRKFSCSSPTRRRNSAGHSAVDPRQGVASRRNRVFDVFAKHHPALAVRLAKGMFAKPAIYPAVARFGNSDPKLNSDFKPDVRSLSFAVDLSGTGSASTDGSDCRQDFSLQNATTLPINDARAFLDDESVDRLEPARRPWSLPFKDRLRVVRTLVLAQMQSRQKIVPYQRMRNWSTVPFAMAARGSEAYVRAIAGQSGTAAAKKQSPTS